jgi:hypothetical protein
LAGDTARKEPKGYVQRILVGNPEGKRPLGRPRLRWEDNIEMYIRKLGWCGMDWADLALDRVWLEFLVNADMELRVPYTAH